jgi:hypothetical protein
MAPPSWRSIGSWPGWRRWRRGSLRRGTPRVAGRRRGRGRGRRGWRLGRMDRSRRRSVVCGGGGQCGSCRWPARRGWPVRCRVVTSPRWRPHAGPSCLAKAMERDEQQLIDVARSHSFVQFQQRLAYWRQTNDPDAEGRRLGGEHDDRRVHLSQTFQGAWALDGILDRVGGSIVHQTLMRSNASCSTLIGRMRSDGWVVIRWCTSWNARRRNAERTRSSRWRRGLAPHHAMVAARSRCSAS